MDNSKYMVLPLFSSPIYVSDIDLDFTDIVNYIQNIEYSLPRSTDTYIIRQPIFSLLKEKIEEHIKNYVTNILCIKQSAEFYITNSWIFKINPNQIGDEHIHSNAIFSGVVYLDDNYTNSGNVFFRKDHNRLSIFTPTITPDITNYNIFNATEWRIEPKQKMILLFPAHLPHRVSRNETNIPRHSLAFNVFVNHFYACWFS